MPTRAVFRCQFCDATPDHGTQRSLQGQVTERMFGEYLDAFPGRWLVWNGGGTLGPRRYACRKHRGDLVAYLRYHYATVAAQVWKMPPYTQRWPDEKRPHMGGSMGIVKFGLRGGLLQDAPPPARDDKPAPAPAPAAMPPPELVAAEPALPEDPFPSDDLLPPEEMLPPSQMFPPGELFVPEEFPASLEHHPPIEESDDDAWPPDAWPPGPPPGGPPPPGPDAPPA